jgi:hypothetical protein
MTGVELLQQVVGDFRSQAGRFGLDAGSETAELIVVIGRVGEADYPFSEEYVSIINPLELPSISGRVFASEDEESPDTALEILLDRMRIGSPNLTSTRAGPR